MQGVEALLGFSSLLLFAEVLYGGEVLEKVETCVGVDGVVVRHGLSNEALASEKKRETIVVNNVPEDFDPQKGLTD